jgi:hypothetical protein
VGVDVASATLLDGVEFVLFGEFHADDSVAMRSSSLAVRVIFGDLAIDVGVEASLAGGIGFAAR